MITKITRAAAARTLLRDVATPCRTDGPWLWLSDSPKDRQRAANRCRGCPILRECAAFAEYEGTTHGVWGGHDRTTADIPEELCPVCEGPVDRSRAPRKIYCSRSCCRKAKRGRRSDREAGSPSVRHNVKPAGPPPTPPAGWRWGRAHGRWQVRHLIPAEGHGTRDAACHVAPVRHGHSPWADDAPSARTCPKCAERARSGQLTQAA